MKLNIFLLSLIVLVGVVSASITVDLNSPLDGSIVTTNNVLFNSTGIVSTSKEYIKNSTLCSNITGSWVCGDTESFLEDLTISSNTQLCGEYYVENFEINNNAIVTVCNYNGTTGTGMLKINAININIESGSSINADGKGYRGATTRVLCAGGGSNNGVSGEGDGGGGGSACLDGEGSGAGGGGFGNSGGAGGRSGVRTAGTAGSEYSNSSNLILFIGSGGGSGSYNDNTGVNVGGNGGGGIFLNAVNINIQGQLTANGNNGATTTGFGTSSGSGGGGAGGDIIIIGDTVDLDGSTIRANGGAGGNGAGEKHCEAGGGAGGRIKTVYESSISNTSTTMTASLGSRGTVTCPTAGSHGGVGTTYYNDDTFAISSEISKDIIYTQTKTVSSGSVVLWNVQTCEGTSGCTFATSNYTFSVDSVAPTIVLNYPTDTLNYGFLGEVVEINYTVTDDNLDKCWYNYNGTNTTPISCTSGVNNLDNITLTTSKSITIYANDTAGNFASQTFTWDYIFFEEGSTFEGVVYETELNNFQINITTGLTILTATGVLNYDGSSYSTTGSCSAGLCQFSIKLDVPLVESGTYSERDFYWTLSLFNGTNNYELNSSTDTQNVSRIYLVECGGAYTTQTLNFTAYRESNLTRINPFYFAGSFNFWLGSGTVKRTNSIEDSSASEVTLCLSPTNRTIFSDAHIDYDYDDANITYTRRNYYLSNSSLTNVSQSIFLYLLESSDATSFIIKVQDQKLSPIEDAYVYIQRYYPSDGTFKTVQVVKTDSSGESVGFYQTETVDYKHIIVKDGVILLETTQQKVVGKVAPFTLTFTVGDTLEFPWSSYEKNPNIQSSLSYNKTTEVVTFTYIDVTGSTTSGRLLVVQPSMSNSTQKVICNVNSTQPSATLTCNLSGLSGNFIAYGYIEEESTDIINFIISTARDIMGNEGLFIGFMIILVAGFAFIWNPVAGVIGINVAVIFVHFIGFITVSPVFIFAMIGISFITIILLKT